MPEARPKIEREKIRKRRPNDLLFDEGETPVARQPHLIDDVDQGAYIDAPQSQDDTQYGNAEEDWTVEEGETQETAGWDHEPEDDWVLEGEDRGRVEEAVEVFEGEEDAHDEFEEESGVVWEDDGFPTEYADDNPDEMSFGPEPEGQSFGFAPEVELAGRRDVRPKAPRPAPAPGTRAPGQPQRRQRAPQGRQSQPDWDAPGEPVGHQPAVRKPAFESRQRATGPAQADGKRFSRTRATLGVTAGGVAGAPDEEVLEQPRSSPPQRRRQAQPAPAMPRAARHTAVRQGKTRGKGLIVAGVLVLLAGIGWFAYQSAGPDGFRSMLDRLSALVPLPGSSRTAADTSFGGRETNETGSVSAEQALSDLEQGIRQEDTGGQTLPAAAPDGPPIPQFKPLPGATRSLSVETSTGTGNEAQLAANESVADEEPANALSIFQQLWKYLSPG